MARKPKLSPALSTLYNAPDMQQSRRLRGGISDLDPETIEFSDRFDDRIDLDISDLVQSIETHGQRVPILVRPQSDGKFTLIYGRRRLEACRALKRTVRAIVTELDDDAALKDQLIENQARRDLSFIERALVATALLEGEHLPDSERTNKSVAEILGLTEAGVSQMISVVRTVGDDLIRAIGSAQTIGRPRWEELKREISGDDDRSKLIEVATSLRADSDRSGSELSQEIFLAVLTAAKDLDLKLDNSAQKRADYLDIDGVGKAQIKITTKGKRFKLDFLANEPEFAGWLEGNAVEALQELHQKWLENNEDEPDKGGTNSGA
ncbi:plasmid partitioning protein RepB [Thioclava sp. GXIMD4215]|uniref:plasmid partitioning protein RepB n=1 Tax=Thioclava sp. GXIMD4215 TaxID=3131928 RepID=UPI00311AEE73